MEAPSSQPLNLCYCYAYKDREYCQEMDKHLTAMKRLGMIQTWYSCISSPNALWKQEVATNINKSHLVLLFMSADFLSAEECYRGEIAYARKRHDQREARVIPIFLSSVDLRGIPLGELSMLPNNYESIANSQNKEQTYVEIVQTIRKIAEEMLEERPIRSIEAGHVYDTLPNLEDSIPTHISSLDKRGSFLSIGWSSLANWLAVGAANRIVRLWDVDNYSDRDILPDHTGSVYSVAWSTNNQLASGLTDGAVWLWNASEKRVIQILSGHTGTVNSVAWSPDGKLLASGSMDKTLRLWNAENGNPLHILTDHKKSIMSVAWSPNGKLLASGSRDRDVRLWYAENGRYLRTFQHQEDVMSVTWSPNGKLLAIGSGSDVWLWDANITEKPLNILQGHTSTVTAVIWSTDGQFLASSSYDQTVCIWNPSQGDRLHTLQGHMGRVIGIAWSPDGQLLATVSYDELSLWSTKTWEQIAMLDRQQALRTIIHQPSRTLRADTTPHDDETFGEFQQQELETVVSQQQGMDILENGSVKGEHVLVCTYCYKPLPEKQAKNRRKRGLTDIECPNCNTSVSLLTSQELSADNVDSESTQAISGMSPQQIFQDTLRRKKDSQAVDAFFCYSRQDQSIVKRIGEQLMLYGILPWIDVWELRPGDRWQNALEKQIRKTKTGVVFVGPQGMKPWQESEMYAILRQITKPEYRIIPVLLPGTPEKLEIPLFLEEWVWVNFRLQEPDPMQQLLRGITGKEYHIYPNNIV